MLFTFVKRCTPDKGIYDSEMIKLDVPMKAAISIAEAALEDASLYRVDIEGGDNAMYSVYPKEHVPMGTYTYYDPMGTGPIDIMLMDIDDEDMCVLKIGDHPYADHCEIIDLEEDDGCFVRATVVDDTIIRMTEFTKGA